MHVAIIGTGSVGSALGRGLAGAGHQVTFGSRDPAAVDGDLLADAGGADAVDQRTAAERGDAVVLAVPGGVVADLAGDLADALAGKPVLDPTNQMERRPEGSLAEDVAAAAPDAQVVKAFNTIGAGLMAQPTVSGAQATMLVCGEECAVAETLADDLGFDPVDAGDLSAAVMLEDLARLWIHLSGLHGRNIAFRLLGGQR